MGLVANGEGVLDFIPYIFYILGISDILYALYALDDTWGKGEGKS